MPEIALYFVGQSRTACGFGRTHRRSNIVDHFGFQRLCYGDQSLRDLQGALLQKGGLRRECPFPVEAQATGTTSAVRGIAFEGAALNGMACG